MIIFIASYLTINNWIRNHNIYNYFILILFSFDGEGVIRIRFLIPYVTHQTLSSIYISFIVLFMLIVYMHPISPFITNNKLILPPIWSSCLEFVVLLSYWKLPQKNYWFAHIGKLNYQHTFEFIIKMIETPFYFNL